jgi:predicted TIM-barrel fold metal-dependent hydrolase
VHRTRSTPRRRSLLREEKRGHRIRAGIGCDDIGSDEALVDTHVHFWDHDAPGLAWSWLAPGFHGPGGRSLHDLDAPRYAVDEFAAEAAGCGVDAIVHIHSAHPVDDPVHETTWLQQLADRSGSPDAIIGACSLEADDAAAIVERHARHPRCRGVRDLSRSLDVDRVGRAMSAAERHSMTVEMRRAHDDVAPLVELAARWPGVTITLGHACMPPRRSRHEFDAWETSMRRLAARPNVVCKISALANAPGWTRADIRPWMLTCVDAFSAERCVLGTNWPLDRQLGSYRGLVDAYRAVLAELDAAERTAVLHGTAARVYRITVTGAAPRP